MKEKKEKIPFNHDSLRLVYSTLNDARINYNELKWETIRTALYLTIGILTAVGGLVASNIEKPPALLIILGFFLWVIGATICIWTSRNIERESKLQFDVEFSMFQIEKILGLHEEIPQDLRWKKEYGYIFGDKHLKSGYGTDPHSWAEERTKNHFFKRKIDRLMIMFGAIYFVIGLSLICIAISQSAWFKFLFCIDCHRHYWR